jgi:hypothetical protein
MNTMQTDRLVDDYLRRLEAAAAPLDRSRRDELVAEIREHIEAALSHEEETGEAAVRNVLERLGPPEEIVEAAEPATGASVGRGRAGGLEITALVALLVPVLGWVVGIVLVRVSEAWSGRDKVVGIALALPSIVLQVLALVGGSGDGSGLGPLEVLVLGLFGGLPSVLFLGWRLRSEG